ncbi:MAG: RNA polymerase sigma-70 factor [Saprospirales bacterium]|nr:RNA polymerase sigma-70 factor [Saprospirales bacterium]
MEVLFKRYYSFVSFATFRLVSDSALAEDISQEVFMEIWKRRHSLNISTSFKAYLRRSAVNRSLNFLRDKKNRYNEELSDAAHDLQTPENQTLEVDELQDHIDKAINQLPPRCQKVFKLSRYEEMSYQEIADDMDISVKTVENQMVKALKLLREALMPFIDNGMLSVILWIIFFG